MIRFCLNDHGYLLLLLLAASTQAQTPSDDTKRDPTVPPEALREFVSSADRSTSPAQGVAIVTMGAGGRFSEVRFVDVSLARAAAELGVAANANVVVSRAVADQRLTLTLRNIDLQGVLDAIAVSQGLVSRRDSSSGVNVLASPEEFQRDVSAFRTERTAVFTLLYPNATDVVRAIGDVFGERVVVTDGANQQFDQNFIELQDRLRRFDLIESRSRGLTGSIGGTQINNQGFFGQGFGRGAFNQGLRGNQGFNNRRIARPRSLREQDQLNLTPEEARELAASEDIGVEGTAAGERVRRSALTYVTAIPRLNRIIVRSADPQTLADIRALIQRLDVPTPLVLLEVRVLRIDLSDGLDLGLSVTFQAGEGAGAFSSGELAAPPAGSVLPGGTGFSATAGLLQIVSSNVQARLELLQSKGRVTALATPVLLTANNEVSRIFSGEQVPIVIGFTEPQVITGGVGAQTTLPATPVTELRDVGTDLLITANINADRTVTLRLLQETSSVNPAGATIVVPVTTGVAGTAFANQSVDTVLSQSASGTIVAQDGQLLAFGGLIEESESDVREQVPILGDLPLVGFLFRRQSTEISRSELVILIRPYVISTPTDGDRISRDLLDAISDHPYRPRGAGPPDGEVDDLGVFRDRQPTFDRSLFDALRPYSIPPSNKESE